MIENKYPIGGYAPGNYFGKCATCSKEFLGDKRASQCEPCALKDKEFYDALTPDQKARFDSRFSEIVKLFFENRNLRDDKKKHAVEFGNYLRSFTPIDFRGEIMWKDSAGAKIYKTSELYNIFNP